jgi:hypothetical protein
MATRFTIGTLKLQDEDFEKVDTMKWPHALVLLLARLGACFFVMDDQSTTKKYIPSKQAHEIAKIIERVFGATEAELDKRAAVLTQAVKAAYDQYVDVQNKLGGDQTVFKPFP